MSTPLDRLGELVAGMTARPWEDDAGGGFISGPDSTVAQTWSKSEEDFPNAGANRAGIVVIRNVAHELIAVARAADGLTWTPGIKQLRPLRDALYRLNAKLAEAVKA